MDLNLKGKTALVTGGASGIGEAIVRQLAAEGASVAVADIDGNAGKKLLGELASTATPLHLIACDLAVSDSCERAVAETVHAFGRLDILVNNAGVNDAAGLDQAPELFMQSLRRNLLHVFACAHFALPHLRAARGAIVNIGSKVSVTGQGRTSGYAAAKGAINALTREWAVALAPDGVRVNCVLPAECDTPQYARWFATLPDPEQARASIEKRIPLGHRMTTPDEVAAMAVFLASPRASHITGQLCFVDGGYTHLDRASTADPLRW